ncbi:GFA family protein [Erythrobacter sp. HA6-11]
MSHSTKTGKCLCGAVQLTAQEAPDEVGVCHCAMCRRWGGGPFLEIDCGTAVSFTGEDNISTYSSSVWAERGFCRNCGTHLFYRIKETGQSMIPVGLFEDEGGLALDMQVFIDKKPSYYSFSQETKEMTGAEVFAMFTESEQTEQVTPSLNGAAQAALRSAPH